MTNAPVAAPPTIPAELADLIVQHPWDELIFGGFICLKCTPDDADDPEQNVYYPCPTLTAAGVTIDMANAVIKAYYDRQSRSVKEAHIAGTTTLPALSDFRDYDGIRAAYVGDHGDIVVLGWHTNPATAFHAMDNLARDVAGIDGVFDSPDHSPSPDDVHQRWAVNTGSNSEWHLTWGVNITCDTPGAFPITTLEM